MWRSPRKNGLHKALRCVRGETKLEEKSKPGEAQQTYVSIRVMTFSTPRMHANVRLSTRSSSFPHDAGDMPKEPEPPTAVRDSCSATFSDRIPIERMRKMNRNPLIVGGSLLVLVVGAIGAFWFFSNEAPASPVAPVAQQMTQEGQQLATGATADPAREPIPLDRVDPIEMTVYLSPTCGCCSNWIEHIEDYGFEVTLEYRVDMNAVKEAFAIHSELASCHTSVVNGYLVEGHVPGEVVREFLAEAPSVRGLAVPGMPVGSPGMEVEGRADPYDVVTFTSAGEVEVYSRQNQG